jgi:hypothetical protein
MASLCDLYSLHFTNFSQLNTYSELLGSLILILFSLVHSISSTESNFRSKDLSHLHFLGLDNKTGNVDQDFL